MEGAKSQKKAADPNEIDVDDDQDNALRMATSMNQKKSEREKM